MQVSVAPIQASLFENADHITHTKAGEKTTNLTVLVTCLSCKQGITNRVFIRPPVPCWTILQRMADQLFL